VPADLRHPAMRLQGGFFLIEAMVAILIFALGILGLVAMGGTAVSAQSDAQYRTQASSLADAIAAQIALGVTRNGDDAAKALSLAAFAHQPTPAPPSTAPWPCTFTGTPALTGTTAPGVFPLLQRAANLTSEPGLPGATAANQQIFIDNTAPNFNRVVITLCWKTAADGAWRRHTLVTYVN